MLVQFFYNQRRAGLISAPPNQKTADLAAVGRIGVFEMRVKLCGFPHNTQGCHGAETFPSARNRSSQVLPPLKTTEHSRLGVLSEGAVARRARYNLAEKARGGCISLKSLPVRGRKSKRHKKSKGLKKH